ncbi:ABC transporter substrate-binding protein [Falsiroseomonas sp. HW251]|uniref:ABC transporter substrate-binding protein n=1 Tax=Falsiroseomonas sp. HW251 TaxID=3390998 RepID=UPI003D3150EA
MTLRLTAAIGRYPHTAALLDGAIASDAVALDFADLPVPNRAFAPMVREQRYDVSEMAIATFLIAKAHGKPLVLLPVTLAARFQEAALLCRVNGPVKGPRDLVGRRVGVRSYSQTTAMWLRGSLSGLQGVASDSVRWITFEGAHVLECQDPPWTERAPKGAELLAMAKSGEVDAAIFGNDLPDDPALTTVFPDPAAAGRDFLSRFGFVPVNHLVCVTRDVATKYAEAVAAIVRMFGEAVAGSDLPVGRAALTPAIELAVANCVEQGLLPRPLSRDEVWDGLPAGID